MGGIDLVIGFIAFGEDGEKADAVNGPRGRTELGHKDAKFVPGEVSEIEENQESEGAEEQATYGKGAGTGRGGCECGRHQVVNLPG